jgi:DNA polymerase-3 subunit epsilon
MAQERVYYSRWQCLMRAFFFLVVGGYLVNRGITLKSPLQGLTFSADPIAHVLASAIIFGGLFWIGRAFVYLNSACNPDSKIKRAMTKEEESSENSKQARQRLEQWRHEREDLGKAAQLEQWRRQRDQQARAWGERAQQEQARQKQAQPEREQQERARQRQQEEQAQQDQAQRERAQQERAWQQQLAKAQREQADKERAHKERARQEYARTRQDLLDTHAELLRGQQRGEGRSDSAAALAETEKSVEANRLGNNVRKRAHKEQALEEIAILDFETTGLIPGSDRPTEIAIVIVRNGLVVDQFQSLMNPQRLIPLDVEQLTGISNSMVAAAPGIEQVMREAARFVGGRAILAHNAQFDKRFWCTELTRLGLSADHGFACTLRVAKRIYPTAPNYRLATLRTWLNLPEAGRAHRALADALTTGQLFKTMQCDLHTRYAIRTTTHELMQKIQTQPIKTAHSFLQNYAAQQ